MNEKTRDYVFDNFKAVLIIFVVFGHIIRERVSQDSLLYMLYTFIYLFHMPAFIFISGYFSKNIKKCHDQSIETLLIPFLVLEVVCYVKGRILNEDILDSFHILMPIWGLWFLLVLCGYRYLLKYLIEIPFILWFSLAMGLIGGFIPKFSRELALGRFVAFLFFFLLGYYCSSEHIKRIRSIPKIISFLVLCAFMAVSYFNAIEKFIPLKALLLRQPYGDLKLMPWYENPNLYIRMFIYVAAIVMTIAVINIVSSRKTIVSYIGQNSVTVYIIHLLIVPTIKRIWPEDWGNGLYLLYSVVTTAIIVFVFALPWVKNLYDVCMGSVVNTIMIWKKWNKIKAN